MIERIQKGMIKKENKEKIKLKLRKKGTKLKIYVLRFIKSNFGTLNEIKMIIRLLRGFHSIIILTTTGQGLINHITKRPYLITTNKEHKNRSHQRKKPTKKPIPKHTHTTPKTPIASSSWPPCVPVPVNKRGNAPDARRHSRAFRNPRL